MTIPIIFQLIRWAGGNTLKKLINNPNDWVATLIYVIFIITMFE